LYGKQQQQPASLFLKEGLIFVKFFRENEGPVDNSNSRGGGGRGPDDIRKRKEGLSMNFYFF